MVYIFSDSKPSIKLAVCRLRFLSLYMYVYIYMCVCVTVYYYTCFFSMQTDEVHSEPMPSCERVLGFDLSGPKQTLGKPSKVVPCFPSYVHSVGDLFKSCSGAW